MYMFRIHDRESAIEHMKKCLLVLASIINMLHHKMKIFHNDMHQGNIFVTRTSADMKYQVSHKHYECSVIPVIYDWDRAYSERDGRNVGLLNFSSDVYPSPNTPEIDNFMYIQLLYDFLPFLVQGGRNERNRLYRVAGARQYIDFGKDHWKMTWNERTSISPVLDERQIMRVLGL